MLRRTTPADDPGSGHVPLDALAGVVLTGGRSVRMGRDKALVEWNGVPMVVRVVRALAEIAGAGVVVVASPVQELPFLPASVRVVRDPSPFEGPLAGLVEGLRAVEAISGHCFVAATDLPLLHASVAARVVSLLGEADAAIPMVGGHPQLLSAAYATRIADRAAVSLASGSRSLRDLASSLDVRWITEADLLADEAVARDDPTLSSFRDADEPSDIEP